MVDPIQGSRPSHPAPSSLPEAFHALQGHLLDLSDLLRRVAQDGSVCDDDHFCHQVSHAIAHLHTNASQVKNANNEIMRDVAVNTSLIVSQKVQTELGTTSLEEAAKMYEKDKGKLMHEVLSTFAMHSSATETLARELHLIATSTSR